MRVFAIVVYLIFVLFTSKAQQPGRFVDYINTPHAWVDSVFNSMTPKERIAQLFMVRAHSNLGQKYVDSVAGVVEREQLGGIVLFQGSPNGHANVVNQYQKLSKVPLLIALDGEWGLGMRLPDSTISYPYQMTLGAIQNNRLIYQMGREVAKDFKRLGLNVNFSPVVDVNNNPNNPVINFRSFGEDKFKVAEKGLAYMQGLMDGGLIVSLKHFPGHGDTDVDSHYELPVLSHNRSRLDSLEMYPFKELINAGAPGVMIAHMNIPSLDDRANMPSSISKPIITGVLKGDLGFRGLVITDAMDMQGVIKYHKNGEADVQAIIAGNDLLELSANSGRAIDLVLEAIEQGRISQHDIDQRVKKVLASKLWLALDQSINRQVNTQNLYLDLNRWPSIALVQKLADESVTLLNGDSLLNTLDFTKSTAIISIGDADHVSTLQRMLDRKFSNSLFYILGNNASVDEIAAIDRELWQYDQIIVSLHDSRSRPRNSLNYGTDVKMFISALANMNSVFTVFANPYAIAGLPGIEQAKSILMCYQNEDFMQRAAARVISKLIKPKGKLPVSINSYFKGGDGIVN